MNRKLIVEHQIKGKEGKHITTIIRKTKEECRNRIMELVREQGYFDIIIIKELGTFEDIN